MVALFQFNENQGVVVKQTGPRWGERIRPQARSGADNRLGFASGELRRHVANPLPVRFEFGLLLCLPLLLSLALLFFACFVGSGDGHAPFTIFALTELAFVQVQSIGAAMPGAAADHGPQQVTAAARLVCLLTIHDEPLRREFGETGEGEIVQFQGIARGNMLRCVAEQNQGCPGRLQGVSDGIENLSHRKLIRHGIAGDAPIRAVQNDDFGLLFDDVGPERVLMKSIAKLREANARQQVFELFFRGFPCIADSPDVFLKDWPT